MFDRMFRWTMRRGSRLLFIAALVFYAVTVVQLLVAMLQVAGDARWRLPESLVLQIVGTFFSATFYTATVFLFMALLVDRADRYLARRSERS